VAPPPIMEIPGVLTDANGEPSAWLMAATTIHCRRGRICLGCAKTITNEPAPDPGGFLPEGHPHP
jgi:hypothetical protein